MTGTATAFPVDELDELAHNTPGRSGFYIEDLNTGARYERSADDLFPTASICKVPVMVELFRQVEEGMISFDDRRRLPPNTSRQFATGHLRLLWDEPELTLRDYARLMIQVTDDMATDALMEVVGLDGVNETMDRMGLTNTRVTMDMGRWHYTMVDMGVEPVSVENDRRAGAIVRAGMTNDASLSYQGSLQNNVTTPREMGTILRMLHEGKVVSPAASSAMIALLKGTQSRTRIPHHVSPDVAIAHKTGGSGRIKGDVGILYLPSGPLIVSALAITDRREDGHIGADAIAQATRLAVGVLSPESLA